MSDPVVHFELPADDVPRAQSFYAQAFGWKINAIPNMGYTLLHTTKTDDKGMIATPGHINGGMLARQAFFQAPILTIEVKDIEAALRVVAREGGKVIRGSQPIPGVGFAAYFKDPEGNVMGLIQPTR